MVFVYNFDLRNDNGRISLHCCVHDAGECGECPAVFV